MQPVVHDPPPVWRGKKMPLLAAGIGAVGAQFVQLAGVIPGSVNMGTTASAVVRSSGATIGVGGV